MICPACLYVHAQPGDRCVACGTPLPGPERARPFVGRGRALAWLDGQLEQVLKTGRPRFVAVAGQPGVGRSRLLEEFRRRHDNPFSDVEVLHGFPVRRARAADPFSPFGRLLHVALGLDERMGPEPRLARIRQAVQPLSPPAADEAVRGLAAVLGVSSAPALDDRRDAGDAFAAVRWYLAARARRAPLVVVLEGMDRASADGRRLYAELRVELDRGSMLVVAETTPAGVGALGVAPGATWVLPPLDQGGVGQLLQALTDQPGAPPASLLASVLSATGGSPRAVREAAEALVDAGVVKPGRVGWRLPDEVDALPPLTRASAVSAGLARLDPTARRVVDHAAFVGPVSWVGALLAAMRIGHTPAPGTWPDEPGRAAVTEALEAARAAGVLERRPDADLPGEPAWGFVSEAVHATVRQRARLEPARPRHRIVAAWLLAREVQASPADLAILAEHHEAGGDPGRAAEAWIAAGERLGASHAVEEAVTAYERALDCLEPTAADRRLAVHHALGVLHDRAGRPTVADACFEAMLADAWALDHRAKAGAALNRLGRSLRRQSRHADAERLLAAGRALFEQAGDVAGVAASVDDLGQVALLRGALEEAVERFREALEARREAGDDRGVALSLTNIGRAMREAGDPEGAEAAFKEAATIRRRIDDTAGRIDTALALAELRLAMGKLEAAAEAAERALQLARDISSTGQVARALAVSALLRMTRSGDPESALMAREALELAEQVGDAPTAARALRALALTAAEAAPGNALAHLERAIGKARRHGDRFELAGSLRMAVTLHLRLADVDVQGRSAELRAGASLAPLDPVSVEHLQEAVEGLEEAISVFDAVHDDRSAVWSRRVLARVHESLGELAQGQALRDAAAEVEAAS